MPTGPSVRVAGPGDAAACGALLHRFNTEYDEPTPGPDALAARVAELLADGDTAVLLGGSGPDGLAVLRFRKAIWTAGLECHLAELYVVPARRGQGLGRALLQRALEVARERGADHMDLGTSEDDVAARGLYAALGFRDTERPEGGPRSLYLEREL